MLTDNSRGLTDTLSVSSATPTKVVALIRCTEVQVFEDGTTAQGNDFEVRMGTASADPATVKAGLTFRFASGKRAWEEGETVGWLRALTGDTTFATIFVGE